MKSLLIKIVKHKVLLIVLSAVLVTIITILIVFGPKRLASKVNPNGIAYVVVDPKTRDENNSQYIIDNENDIQLFSKLIKKAIYIKWWWSEKSTHPVYLEIHYHNGTVVYMFTTRITVNNNQIHMLITNFDFNAVFELAGLYGRFGRK